MITDNRVLPFNNNYEEVWKQYIVFIFIDKYPNEMNLFMTIVKTCCCTTQI